MPQFDKDTFHVRSKRKQGWFWVDNAIIDTFSPIIGYAALSVYMVLCRRADNSDQSCYPSISGISRDLKMGRDKIIESLEILQKESLIRCDKAGKSSGVTNTYYILELPEGSPKAGLPNKEEKSQGRTTSSPKVGPGVVLRQDSKEDSVKEDSFNKTVDDIDTTQNLLPWMEKQWDENQRTQSKILRKKFNPGPHPEQYERQQEAIGVREYRQAFLDYLHGSENHGIVNFAKLMAPEVPRKQKSSNGNGSHQKTTAELFREKNPHLFTQAQ